MQRAKKYWIVCVSKEHAKLAVEGGIIQACHGKERPLRRMRAGDELLIYSSKNSITDTKSTLQTFTAIGKVADDEVYQYQMGEDFIPFRRRVEYRKCEEIPILPLIYELRFIPNKQFWGYPFRYGILEIGFQDFELIYAQLVKGTK
ncbi:MAG: EVE domain-containing protein [Campylobacteraceae bacterium]|jgi:predicted RNA-binding protein|nr:EVE domain-containing protein [Campylobacteraceae bacterium]